MNDDKRTGLPQLLDSLHQMLLMELGIARTAIGHPGTKGDVSEGRWIEMLQNHLPSRYQVSKAFVIDSQNQCSDQIDIVIHDRQYSPFVLKFGSAIYVPAESVYGIFEVKQEMTATEVEYAGSKIASVRKLHRTSIPIKHAGGTYPAKAVQPILGGLLCLKSSWSKPFGEKFLENLKKLPQEGLLNLGCAAENGVFEIDDDRSQGLNLRVHDQRSPLAYFLLRLIAKLQDMATVPCLNIMAYAHWLQREPVATNENGFRKIE